MWHRGTSAARNGGSGEEAALPEQPGQGRRLPPGAATIPEHGSSRHRLPGGQTAHPARRWPAWLRLQATALTLGKPDNSFGLIKNQRDGVAAVSGGLPHAQRCCATSGAPRTAATFVGTVVVCIAYTTKWKGVWRSDKQQPAVIGTTKYNDRRQGEKRGVYLRV